jgi:uracil phosphoribosyltransferase
MARSYSCIVPCVPVHLVSHPVAEDALLMLRDAQTPPIEFRRAARRISTIVLTEALRDVPTERRTVQTPLEAADAAAIAGDVVIVPVLRAGLGMLEAALDLVPTARVGHLGLKRDETTAVASRYYAHLPEQIGDSFVLLIDPMLATGGSAVASLDLLVAAGARHLRLACVVAAPEGIAAVERRHPGVHIYTPAVDRALNARKFILPGLGDFGDRLYGTV